MGIYFGTDGIRGKVNADLTKSIAYKIGNALSSIKEGANIIVGADTRITNSYLATALATGATNGGANVIDVGVLPTAGIAFLTKTLKADYGVVISASHNPPEYNGLKVFDGNGYKLGDKKEEELEKKFIHEKVNDFPNIGRYSQNHSLCSLYEEYLLKNSRPLEGFKIALDCANGASFSVAPKVFKALGADVITINATDDGLKINDNAGALYPEVLSKVVLESNADMGFCFDGDADRLIAINQKGEVIDGDVIICGLAKYLKEKGKLNSDTVVGTSHTNMAVERELNAIDVSLIRTQIGDKYVLSKMIEKDLSLGGEQSGHIILKDLSTTGDGILSALTVANILSEKRVSFSEFFNTVLYPQENRDVICQDKHKVLNSEQLLQVITKYNIELSKKGRLMVRASGTEPKIRIMVESQDQVLNHKIADLLASLVKTLDGEN